MKKTFNHIISAMTFSIFLLIALGSGDEEAAETSAAEETQASVETIEGTKSCLVGYDWVYPAGSNPMGALKFLSDGTFSSSTTLFGGISKWGNWSVSSPGEVKLSYTRTTVGTIPADQIVTMPSCNGLKIGSTLYSKD